MCAFFCLVLCLAAACNSENQQQKPSGIKNMAPLPVSDTIQEGLDIEPNNIPMQASPVTLSGDGIQWRGTLHPNDVDVYRIKAKVGTIADIAVIPESAADIIAGYALTEAERDRRDYDSFAHGKSENLYNIRLTPQGGFLTVRARNLPDAADIPYRVAITRVMPEDDGDRMESEPNDSRENALTIPLNAAYRGALYPSGDVDVYRIAISQSAFLQLDTPETACEISLYAADKVIFQDVSRKKQTLKIDIPEPGDLEYMLEIKALETIDEPMPYRIGLFPAAMENTEIEPNDSVEQAQTIRGDLGQMEFSLSGPGDVDFFRMHAPAGNFTHIRLVGVEDGRVKIDLVDETGSKRDTAISDGMRICDIPAQTAPLLLRVSAASGNSVWPMKYRLEAESHNADVMEHEPNNSSEQATPLPIGVRTQAHIFPASDVDYYAVSVPSFPGIDGPVGKLNIHIDGGYAAGLLVKLQDGAGYEISQARTVQASKPLDLAFDAPAGGYQIIVRGSGDRCARAYVVSADFKPSSEAVAAMAARETGQTPSNDAGLTQNSQPVQTFPEIPAPPKADPPSPTETTQKSADSDDIAQILEAAGAKPIHALPPQPESLPPKNSPAMDDEDAF